ncbi:MAG: ATP-dependent DNA ligase [Bacillota bacterium]|uniref:DNA ligase (ATP) n=1 Tax=Thermanaerosceptrum fracticalcis TaxID=1712410 RepID=A0A7G6E7C4_THEFR|nr:RNA ligase family protein [Thermanaerosceptrum fracticalcis]QNB47978.1 DNA ligase [Thermanaerosceptrum fracticalcis]
MQLQPIIPFEPMITEQIPRGEQWIAQVKWDGVRVLTYFDGQEVRLFNRKRNERTMQFPEFVEIKRYLKASSVILDGEIIALHNGKPSFHEVMRRDGIRKPENVEKARKETPVTYMLFDVVYYNGVWVKDQSLQKRQEILMDIITPQENVQLVENFADGESLFTAIKANGMEGIVCKDLNSTYAINGKDGRWQKVKNYRDLIAVVGGVTLRDGVVNALLLGLYDHKGQLWYIGHAGTGKLTHTEWRNLTAIIKPLAVKQSPFINQPQRMKEAVWLKPKITLRIKFTEWTKGRVLRQPSIQAFVDVSPEECMFLQTNSFTQAISYGF